jgi:hypothetical protein
MLTTRVPTGVTPQPNFRKNGSVRETPADNDIEPGIGIGDELGIGTGTELKSGTDELGIDVPLNGAADVGITLDVEVVPRRSRKSNPSPRMDTSRPALTTTTRRNPNGVPAGQPTNGTESRVTSAASTVTRGESGRVGAVGLFVPSPPLHAAAATNAGIRNPWTQFEKPTGIEHLAVRSRANRMRRGRHPIASWFGSSKCERYHRGHSQHAPQSRLPPGRL